jgi:hypothetical protein
MDSLGLEGPISGNSVVVAAKGQISADLADETVVLDLGAGMYYGLDVVGTRIWSLIQEPRSVDAVRAVLLAEYAVDPKRCERELVAFLQELAAHELIEVQDAPDT